MKHDKNRITPEIQQEIRERYTTETISKRKLGRDYGLTVGRLDEILSDKKQE